MRPTFIFTSVSRSAITRWMGRFYHIYVWPSVSKTDGFRNAFEFCWLVVSPFHGLAICFSQFWLSSELKMCLALRLCLVIVTDLMRCNLLLEFSVFVWFYHMHVVFCIIELKSWFYSFGYTSNIIAHEQYYYWYAQNYFVRLLPAFSLQFNTDSRHLRSLLNERWCHIEWSAAGGV